MLSRRQRDTLAALADALLPDGAERAAIAAAAALLPLGPLVGHCSGACGLKALEPHACFSMHQLMTMVDGQGGDGRWLVSRDNAAEDG